MIIGPATARLRPNSNPRALSGALAQGCPVQCHNSAVTDTTLSKIINVDKADGISGEMHINIFFSPSFNLNL